MISKVYTTEELIEILEEERHACLQGKRLNLSTIAPTGNQVIDYFMKKSEGVQKFVAYQDFQAAIHEYQREYQVSGIIWHEITLKGETLRFPMVDDNLIALPDDLTIMKDRKIFILDFWHKVTQEMDLYLCLNQAKIYQPVTQEEVDAIAQRTEWANLLKWEREDFLEILLQLGWGQPQEAPYKQGWPSSGSEYIHGVKPGKKPIC
jgi:hypothetical protein